MENLLNLSAGQLMVALLIQVWVVVIFPVIVIRKINYLTALIEGLYEEEPDGKTDEPSV